MKTGYIAQRFLRQRRGMVLVIALWVLSILTVFALAIGIGIRQKLMLVSRLEKRNEIHYAARSGVQVARMAFANKPQPHFFVETAKNKAFKHNNPAMFQRIMVGEGMAEVRYLQYDAGIQDPVVLYGLEDEAGKLNINYASIDELGVLFMLTAALSRETAMDLAAAVVDWRGMGDSRVTGFYSDEYYRNLRFPYEPKRRPFELLEEVCLVKGMNPEIFERLKSFLTVYGDGKVNINTASKPVLMALGLSSVVIDVLISGRNGPDQIPATEDDYIFRDSGVSLRLDGFAPLSSNELAQIDQLYVGGKISAVSHFFQAKVRAVLADGKETRFIDCIFREGDGKIFSWREY